MTEKKLLIIEDDVGLQKQMRWCFDGIETHVADSVSSAEDVLRRAEPQVITLDLGLPPDPGGTREGFTCLELIRSLLPDSKVIVITGREEHEAAMNAIGLGAYDFYQKPIDSQTLRFVVDRAFRLWELENENRRHAANSVDAPLEGFNTADQCHLELCGQVERVAPADVTLMILGETGTGKEIIAQNVHRLSDRARGPFVAINCAAIPENLLESELFGHEKGAFTGAISRKIGRIEAANGGTLFLDEIGDMPMPLQAKILRFLQERSFERVGGTSSIETDVRVLSATHHSLENMIQTGTFREDLYYRLSEISLTLPPLRERGEDVILLARYFLRRASDGLVRLGSAAVEALRAHTWPGNIRELENRIKRAAILCENKVVTPGDLELDGGEEAEIPLNLKQVRADAEKSAILQAMSRSHANVSKASRMLGVSRPTLYSLFKKHGIDPEPMQ